MPATRSPPHNPIFNNNRLKLGIFGMNGKGTANTLAPEAHRPTWENNVRAAQAADAAGLEAIVPYSRWKGHEVGDLDHPSGVILEPFTWAAGLAQATRYSAIFATTAAPTMHPIAAAKQAATIDIISCGRFALNVVAGWNRAELEMFGAPLKEHEERYKHLQEWITIIKRVWSEEREFDFDGEFFHIVNGGGRPQPIQKPGPPIMNAGGSETGLSFALRNADMCFVQLRGGGPDEWRAQVESYKRTAKDRFNRAVQVWIMATIIQRATAAEADDFLQYYAVDNADDHSLDAWVAGVIPNSASVPAELMKQIRLRGAATAGGSIIKGTADQVAEQLQALSQAGVDGLLLGYVDYDDGLARLTQEVLPRLEARGLRQAFHT